MEHPADKSKMSKELKKRLQVKHYGDMVNKKKYVYKPTVYPEFMRDIFSVCGGKMYNSLEYRMGANIDIPFLYDLPIRNQYYHYCGDNISSTLAILEPHIVQDGQYMDFTGKRFTDHTLCEIYQNGINEELYALRLYVGKSFKRVIIWHLKNNPPVGLKHGKLPELKRRLTEKASEYCHRKFTEQMLVLI